MLGAFAGIAFLLAGIGIHGLLSFAVSHRAQEIGVRMAMGAQRRDILGMVLAEGLTLAVIGVIAGVALAYAAGRSMEALLAGITPVGSANVRHRHRSLARHDNRRQPAARPAGSQSRSVGRNEVGVRRKVGVTGETGCNLVTAKKQIPLSPVLLTRGEGGRG